MKSESAIMRTNINIFLETVDTSLI